MRNLLNYQFNDGGRAAAGFKGTTGDCVVRSIAIVTGKPYKEVYDTINQLCKEQKAGARLKRNAYGFKYEKFGARTGVLKDVYRPYLESLGYKWFPLMKVGSGCQVHMRADELPEGKIICSLSHHLAAVIDGVLNDTYDSSRFGTRCVYGYYYKP